LKQDRYRIGLVSTSLPNDKGSMRAYVETVQDALARHAPHVETEVLELAEAARQGVFGKGLGVVAQHLRARRARRRAPDLWHVLDGSQAHVASAFGSAPVVVTVHDLIPQLQDRGCFDGVPPLGRAARLFWRANGKALRVAPALACVSLASATDAQREFGVDPGCCHLVPNALRPSIRRLVEARGAQDRLPGVVLHVGYNGFYKNRRGVLEVFSMLDRAVGTQLRMAGPAPGPDLLQFVQERRIGDRVEWLIDPNDTVLAQSYREASLLLFPSRYEGFGWPVLEAMAFGLPVVCSDGGSLPEVVGDAGPTHSSSDLEALAASATALLTNGQAAAAASARGLRRAAEFSSERFADNLLETYAAALKRAGRSAA
jgi:glycosyltransferase involved in cell wall biosynthesis